MTAKPSTAEGWHHVALRFSVKANIDSLDKYANAPDDIVRGALFSIAHDATLVHRAIDDSVAHGWSSAAAAMTRTMFDLLVSQLAVLNSTDSKLAAFRYFYSGFRYASRDITNSPAARRSFREQIRRRMGQLPDADRPAAFAFLKERDRAYWFSDEWKGPSEVLKRFGPPGFDMLYRQFSAAAHGGFLGMRVFRDEPDDLNINPRLPHGRHARANLLASTRLLFELCRLRIDHEGLSSGPLCRQLTARFIQWGRAQGYSSV